MAIWLTITLFNVQPDTYLENLKFFELDKISKYIGKLGSKTQEKTCNVNSTQEQPLLRINYLNAIVC